MNVHYGPGNVERLLLTHCCICTCSSVRPNTHQMAGSTSAWNDVMTAILKVWRQIVNTTSSIDGYIYLKTLNTPAKFHPKLIWRSL